MSRVVSNHCSHSDAYGAADRLTLATGKTHRPVLAIEGWDVVELQPAELVAARQRWLMRESELLLESAANYERMAFATVPHRRPPFLALAASRRAAAHRLLAEGAAGTPVSTRGEVHAEAS